MSRLGGRRRTAPILPVALACLFGGHLIGSSSAAPGGVNLPIAPIVAALIVASCQGRASSVPGLAGSGAGGPIRSGTCSRCSPRRAHVLIVLVNGGLGAPLPTSDQLAHWPDVPGTFVVLLVLIGIGEEAGWTAFMAPILLRRHGFWPRWRSPRWSGSCGTSR